ncbi:hypothetical protein CP532_5810 [Ophiocordyceps camponoti-leonardi (nom. inval.)]|nr:hypothetical protein CP532_5810 [Ophiocordyceps camponoti-leonardi (nom. inval.)]
MQMRLIFPMTSPRTRPTTSFWSRPERSLLVSGIGNLANAASLLWHAYKAMPAPSNAVNWAGK